MEIRKSAAIYSIIIGIAMIGMWIMFLATGQVPEFETKPYEISFHIISEILTAILLLTSGTALLSNKSWGYRANLVSLGMLLYSAISEGLGYFVQNGEVPMIIVFSGITVFTLFFIFLNLKSQQAQE